MDPVCTTLEGALEKAIEEERRSFEIYRRALKVTENAQARQSAITKRRFMPVPSFSYGRLYHGPASGSHIRSYQPHFQCSHPASKCAVARASPLAIRRERIIIQRLVDGGRSS